MAVSFLDLTNTERINFYVSVLPGMVERGDQLMTHLLLNDLGRLVELELDKVV